MRRPILSSKGNRVFTIISLSMAAVFSLSLMVVRWLLQILGLSTIIDDTRSAERLVIAGLNWLFLTPWWIFTTLAFVWTALLVYLAWRNAERSDAADRFITKAEEAYDFMSSLKRSAKLKALSGSLMDSWRDINELNQCAHRVAHNGITYYGHGHSDPSLAELYERGEYIRQSILQMLESNGEEALITSDMRKNVEGNYKVDVEKLKVNSQDEVKIYQKCVELSMILRNQFELLNKSWRQEQDGFLARFGSEF